MRKKTKDKGKKKERLGRESESIWVNKNVAMMTTIQVVENKKNFLLCSRTLVPTVRVGNALCFALSPEFKKNLHRGRLCTWAVGGAEAEMTDSKERVSRPTRMWKALKACEPLVCLNAREALEAKAEGEKREKTVGIAAGCLRILSMEREEPRTGGCFLPLHRALQT